MGIPRSWKGFIKHSLEVFSPQKKGDNAIAAMALKVFQERVILNNLNLPAALSLLSDQGFTTSLIQTAREEITNQVDNLELKNFTKLAEIDSKVQTVTDLALAIQLQNDFLVKENALLHRKLDEANQMLHLAKKRAIRYFKTSLTISVSGIALGVAMRYGVVDSIKDRAISVVTNISQHQLASKSASPHDGTSLNIGPFGHCLATREANIRLFKTEKRILKQQNSPSVIELKSPQLSTILIRPKTVPQPN